MFLRVKFCTSNSVQDWIGWGIWSRKFHPGESKFKQKEILRCLNWLNINSISSIALAKFSETSTSDPTMVLLIFKSFSGKEDRLFILKKEWLSLPFNAACAGAIDNSERIRNIKLHDGLFGCKVVHIKIKIPVK